MVAMSIKVIFNSESETVEAIHALSEAYDIVYSLSNNFIIFYSQSEANVALVLNNHKLEYKSISKI